MGLQQPLPGLSQQPAQSPLPGQAQAERECGGFRQFRHQPVFHHPAIGLKAIDAGAPGVQHQTQRILVADQGQTIPVKPSEQLPRFLQAPSQLLQSLACLPQRQGGFAGGQQQGAGTGGLQPAQAAVERVGVDPAALLPQHGCLRQAGC